MKAMFGFFVFLLFLAGIALVMLQGRQMAQQNLPGGGSGLVGVKWRPTYIGADSVPNDTVMFVQFALDGSVNGHGGCNTFFGSLEKTDAGVEIGPLGATRMACAESVMTLETAFMNALQNIKKFEVSSDRLLLVDGENNLLIDLIGEK
ncbi:MAG: META domain-containing protein [Gammaproteobacteria bacterium]|nr:META domain-containing protein [Gammaproteobacteria bacterium]